ncbi:DinB family protein [uncultured Williamsia sp.]|uniref:DinB family protein n=1 Tax=uncultured Williamsia sp. TaxID=259311 RepID=UPI0026147950|nr:DinB family protein [uncultured Williamsia sp.]
MPIEPDTKNWTWVLQRRCDACGLDASSLPFRAIPDLVDDNVARWPAALAVPDPATRPDEATWSPLEYAAHVRDVFRRFAVRLDAMLTSDVPPFANWDQDATARAERYRDQDPTTVLQELAEAGRSIADAFRAVPDAALARAGRRSDGSVFTVESLGRYFVHDPIHHLFDVTGERFVS